MLRWLSLGLATACCLVLFRIGVLAPKHVTINANEGWNAYHATDAIAGQPLYPDPPDLISTNYPPLSFYIVGGVGTVIGDMMLAGRVVSLISFVIWAIALALVARRLDCSWAESTCAACLFAATLLAFSDFYVGVNDPQMLGLAVAAGGPLVLLREPRTRGSLWATALLFAVSMFIKHNLVAIPLACVLWLLIYDRPAGWRLMAYGALLGIAGVAICVGVFGRAFLAHLLMPRLFSIGGVMTMNGQWLPRLVLPLVVLAMLIRRFSSDRHVVFGVLLAAISTIVGMIAFGKAGMYWNATFDATWGLGLVAALALNRLASAAVMTRARLQAAIVVAFLAAPAIAVASSASIHWGSPRFWLDPRWSEVDSSEHEIVFLRAHPGRGLCENLALCYWAGKPAEVDFFNYSERIRNDPRADETLVRLVETRSFAVAQIDDLHDVGPRFADALKRNYRLDHQAGQWGSFFVPR